MLLDKLSSRLESVQEFEKEKVPASHWKSWSSFLGMYAGEHTAGTEFVIGPMFVAHGVAAGDLVLGLLWATSWQF